MRTCYAFQTQAGAATFFALMREKLVALVAPDATDDEIRRETAHFGVVAGGGLEEKGTVYVEMCASWQQHDYVAFHALHEMLYGMCHPLGREAGGTPEGIRASTPVAVRAFHGERYGLRGMGALLVGAQGECGVAAALAVGGASGAAAPARPARSSSRCSCCWPCSRPSSSHTTPPRIATTV